MRQRMRVLVATVTAGAGHLAAAAALEEAWNALRPGDAVDRIDVLKFFSPLSRKVYSEGYLHLAERAPELWGLVFKKTDSPRTARLLNRIKRAFPGASRRRFIRHVKQFRPDVALCTHYLPLEILVQLRAKGSGHKPIIVSVVTDFEAHALWMEAGVDLYCVAAEETKARLVARGVDPEKVIATGIPIAARFAQKPDPGAIRKSWGWRDDLPVVLVLGGGFGMGPVAQVLSELDKAPGQFQTVVVTGRNEELRRELAARDRKHPTHVLGFVTNMNELMAAARLIVSKPGGLTSSEALASGKPLLIIDPIPGQEAANSDFLLERGAAAKANRVEDIPHRIGQLLGTGRFTGMARAARKLGRPFAARDVCLEALNFVLRAEGLI